MHKIEVVTWALICLVAIGILNAQLSDATAQPVPKQEQNTRLIQALEQHNRALEQQTRAIEENTRAVREMAQAMRSRNNPF